MTECVIVGKECNCDPNHREQWDKRLVITEGQTVIWMCPHCDVFVKQRKETWEKRN